jgi:hypothetical protein
LDWHVAFPITAFVANQVGAGCSPSSIPRNAEPGLPNTGRVVIGDIDEAEPRRLRLECSRLPWTDEPWGTLVARVVPDSHEWVPSEHGR